MDSAAAYEERAHEFLRSRDQSSVGRLVVERWGQTLRSGASVIELACGAGYPVTKVLSESGLRLWAIDSSPTLVAEFMSRFPNIPVRCARVQACDFFDRTYDGAIAIGLIFLLPEPDQATLISSVARILVPGGRLLFTAPIETGEWRDINTGLVCKSLGRTAYVNLLQESGFRLVDTHIDVGANHYYDAERLK